MGGGKTLEYAFFWGGKFYLLGEMGGGVNVSYHYTPFCRIFHFKPLKGLSFQDLFPGEHAPGPA